MDQLPAELVTSLCALLDRPSLRSFRLVCKAFAEIAEEHLFEAFEFRLYPNHQKLSQLEQLASNTSIASRLQCLWCESGIQLEYADYRYWAAQEYAEISSSWDRSLAVQGASRIASKEFHERLQARFTPDLAQRYDLYRWHLDQEARLMAEQEAGNTLARILRVLQQSCPDLRLKMIMNEPQIHLEDLESFNPQQYASDLAYSRDPRSLVQDRRQHCLSHFVNFLEAAQSAGCRVTELTAIDVPYELFATEGRTFKILDTTISRLKRLELKVSTFPHSDWLSRHGPSTSFHTWRTVPAHWLLLTLRHGSVEHLSLDFAMGLESEYSISFLNAPSSVSHYRAWLPPLKSLSLCHFRCSWAELERVLVEGRNLDSVVLKNCRLKLGSMLDVLEHLSQRRFSTVSVLGTWNVDQDQGEWHSHGEDDFTTCSAATVYEGPYTRTGLRSKVEDFIHGRGECPLPRRTLGNGAHKAVWETMGDTSWHFMSLPPQP